MGHVAAVRCVQYDGRRVVSGAYDFMVKVWDPETETCLHTLQGHTNRVYSLQVSSFRFFQDYMYLYLYNLHSRKQQDWVAPANKSLTMFVFI